MPVERPFDLAAVRSLIIAGWTGRDRDHVEAHIRELEAAGVPRPSRTPMFYRAASSLLVADDAIEVVGANTSGEVEFVLVMLGDDLWVGLGSDHTDREAEQASVARSKQLCAKPVAPMLWRFADVQSHWDQVVLRAWAEVGGARRLYQEGTCAAMLAPRQLIAAYDATRGMPSGAAMFGGTLPTLGAITPANSFEMEMHDPVLGRTLRHRYRITSLPLVT
jgi:hypothetical protein